MRPDIWAKQKEGWWVWERVGGPPAWLAFTHEAISVQEHRRPETLSLSLDVSSLHVCFWENSLVSLNFSSHLREQMNIQGFFFLKKKKISACVCMCACSNARTCVFARVWALCCGYRPIFGWSSPFPWFEIVSCLLLCVPGCLACRLLSILHHRLPSLHRSAGIADVNYLI